MWEQLLSDWINKIRLEGTILVWSLPTLLHIMSYIYRYVERRQQEKFLCLQRIRSEIDFDTVFTSGFLQIPGLRSVSEMLPQDRTLILFLFTIKRY